MRLITALLLGLAPLPIKACESTGWERVYDPSSLEICTSPEFEDHDAVGDDHFKFTAYEIETSPECGCIVAGMYKYVTSKDGELGQTAALVDFGYGECDGWAVKTLCVEGKCEHPLATMCKFPLECGPNAH